MITHTITLRDHKAVGAVKVTQGTQGAHALLTLLVCVRCVALHSLNMCVLMRSLIKRVSMREHAPH